MLKPRRVVFHQNRYAAELDRLVVKQCSWLDIGAGHRIHNGWIGPSCDDLASRPEYFAGCDLGVGILAHPHLHDPKIADCGELPWPDCRFDVVTANMVVEHLENPNSVLKEVFRVLRPGGSFLFVTPNLNHPVVRMATAVPPRLRRYYRIIIEGAEEEDVFPTTYSLNTVSAVKRVASLAGFQVLLCEVFHSRPPVLPSLLGRLESGALSVFCWLGLTGLGSNLIVELRKPSPPAG